jgi:polyphosphate glucokinase
MKILVIDVGGTHIKVLVSRRKQPLEIPSGPMMTAAKMVAAVRKATADWTYDAVSIGYPGPVVHNRPVCEPHNLGAGWVGFEFEKAFGRPVKIVNDAAMQALGSYRGGRMLFLGLGTGLGSALIIDGVLEPSWSQWSWRICHTKTGARTRTTLASPDLSGSANANGGVTLTSSSSN